LIPGARSGILPHVAAYQTCSRIHALNILSNIAAISCLWALLAGPLIGTARADVAVPALSARVTDLTATLSNEQRAALEATLKGVEEKSAAQIAVLLVPSTQPETIEQYSMRVAEAWKLGRKGVDDGLLLLVAKNDRRVRIEVGYGLEGIIPDAVARRVIGETITPRFKQGDFAGGIQAGVLRLAALIAGKAQAGKTEAGAPRQEVQKPLDDAAANPSFSERVIANISDLPLWFLLALVAFGTALRWLLGPLIGALAMGGITGGGAWLITGTIEIAIAAGVVGFLFVLVGLLNWLSMGFGGSSSGSGGGGFSGGGGGFGGGGASGSW